MTTAPDLVEPDRSSQLEYYLQIRHMMSSYTFPDEETEMSFLNGVVSELIRSLYQDASLLVNQDIGAVVEMLFPRVGLEALSKIFLVIRGRLVDLAQRPSASYVVESFLRAVGYFLVQEDPSLALHKPHEDHQCRTAADMLSAITEDLVLSDERVPLMFAKTGSHVLRTLLRVVTLECTGHTERIEWEDLMWSADQLGRIWKALLPGEHASQLRNDEAANQSNCGRVHRLFLRPYPVLVWCTLMEQTSQLVKRLHPFATLESEDESEMNKRRQVTEHAMALTMQFESLLRCLGTNCGLLLPSPRGDEEMWACRTPRVLPVSIISHQSTAENLQADDASLEVPSRTRRPRAPVPTYDCFLHDVVMGHAIGSRLIQALLSASISINHTWYNNQSIAETTQFHLKWIFQGPSRTWVRWCVRDAYGMYILSTALDCLRTATREHGSNLLPETGTLRFLLGPMFDREVEQVVEEALCNHHFVLLESLIRVARETMWIALREMFCRHARDPSGHSGSAIKYTNPFHFLLASPYFSRSEQEALRSIETPSISIDDRNPSTPNTILHDKQQQQRQLQNQTFGIRLCRAFLDSGDSVRHPLATRLVQNQKGDPVQTSPTFDSWLEAVPSPILRDVVFSPDGSSLLQKYLHDYVPDVELPRFARRFRHFLVALCTDDYASHFFEALYIRVRDALSNSSEQGVYQQFAALLNEPVPLCTRNTPSGVKQKALRKGTLDPAGKETVSSPPTPQRSLTLVAAARNTLGWMHEELFQKSVLDQLKRSEVGRILIIKYKWEEEAYVIRQRLIKQTSKRKGISGGSGISRGHKRTRRK